MRILLLLIAIVLQFAATAQTAVISGKIINPTDNKVSVSYNKGAAIYNFNEVKKEALLDKKGRFKIEIPLDAPAEVTFLHGYEMTFMFLEPGDEIAVFVDTKQFDETIKYTGKGAASNNFMAQYFLKFIESSPEQSKAKYTRLANIDAQNYLAWKDSLETEKRGFYEKNAIGVTGNFKSYFTNKISYESANEKLNYPDFKKYYTQKETELPADYYQFLKNVRVQNDSALMMSEYLNFLHNLLFYEVKHTWKDAQLKEIKFYPMKYQLAKMMLTGKAQEVILAGITKDALGYMPFTESVNLYSDFKTAVKDKDLLNFVAEKYEKKKLLAEGATAPAFSLKDTSGKTVSLQDFKGKIVYMDFWASWCGPCMKEAPYAVKLQQQFKNKDIVFLYVSTDESDEDWIKAIRAKNLGNGIHLLSKSTAENVQDIYDVSGIPSYFLIGRDGKILNGSASRPSDEKTVELLNNALAQP